MKTQVYKKVGRRYVPIGYSDGWAGFPADGIWVVQTTPERKSMECMMRIGEVQDLRPTLDMLVGYRDEIVKYLMTHSMDNIGTRDYVTEMIKEITRTNDLDSTTTNRNSWDS